MRVTQPAVQESGVRRWWVLPASLAAAGLLLFSLLAIGFHDHLSGVDDDPGENGLCAACILGTGLVADASPADAELRDAVSTRRVESTSDAVPFRPVPRPGPPRGPPALA